MKGSFSQKYQRMQVWLSAIGALKSRKSELSAGVLNERYSGTIETQAIAFNVGGSRTRGPPQVVRDQRVSLAWLAVTLPLKVNKAMVLN